MMNASLSVKNYELIAEKRTCTLRLHPFCPYLSDSEYVLNTACSSSAAKAVAHFRTCDWWWRCGCDLYFCRGDAFAAQMRTRPSSLFLLTVLFSQSRTRNACSRIP